MSQTSAIGALTQFFRGFARGLITLPVQDHDTGLVESFEVYMQEHDDRYELQADIPGMSKQDIHVGMGKGMVSVCASMLPCKKEAARDSSPCTTPCYASALRGMQLSSSVDVDGTVAQFKDGQLRLTIPKRRNYATVWITSNSSVLQQQM